MADPKVELARAVFDVLKKNADGLDRKALATTVKASDREMREAVELCAAEPGNRTAIGYNRTL